MIIQMTPIRISQYEWMQQICWIFHVIFLHVVSQCL